VAPWDPRCWLELGPAPSPGARKGLGPVAATEEEAGVGGGGGGGRGGTRPRCAGTEGTSGTAASVHQGVDEGVDTAVNEGQAGAAGHHPPQGHLLPLGQDQHPLGEEEEQDLAGVEGQPGAEEGCDDGDDGAVGTPDAPAQPDMALEPAVDGAVAEGDDPQGQEEGEEDHGQAEVLSIFIPAVIPIQLPVDQGRGAQEEGHCPDDAAGDADVPLGTHHLGVQHLPDDQVALHAEGGEEEDAGAAVDGDGIAAHLAEPFAEQPAVPPRPRSHPEGQGADEDDISHRQVQHEGVHHPLAPTLLGHQHDDKEVPHEAEEEDERVEDGDEDCGEEELPLGGEFLVLRRVGHRWVIVVGGAAELLGSHGGGRVPAPVPGAVLAAPGGWVVDLKSAQKQHLALPFQRGKGCGVEGAGGEARLILETEKKKTQREERNPQKRRGERKTGGGGRLRATR